MLISKDFQFANVPVIKYLLSVHQKIILNIKEAIKNNQRQNLQKALRKDLDNKINIYFNLSGDSLWKNSEIAQKDKKG